MYCLQSIILNLVEYQETKFLWIYFSCIQNLNPTSKFAPSDVMSKT
jgi:hypothetical protein